MDTPSQQNLNQLPIGSPLGDFTITGIVGEGGFGIVYLAYEAALDRVVAIKEYLPSSIAGRTGNKSVMVRSQLNTNAFASGLKNFLREAQMLAKFSHPALVEVHRVWEQNSTAYMAMRYYEGKTLREWRLVHDDFDEGRIRRLLEPVMDALSLLHAQNVIHRDVSPDNILMRGSGTPVLLDLGAARLVIGGMTQALTTILKPGYAPIEQYVDDGTMHQGPWTDVYGLGAVLYYMLTGVAPPQAVARMITDPIRNMAEKVKVAVSPAIIEAVIAALAVRPENRFQNVDDLRDALGWTEPLPAEPRTQYTRTEHVQRGVSAANPITGDVKSAAAITPITKGPVPAPLPISQPLPTAFVRPPGATPAPVPAVAASPIPAPLVSSATMPAMNVFIPTQSVAAKSAASSPLSLDDDKTVIWNSAALVAAEKNASSQSRPRADTASASTKVSTAPPARVSVVAPPPASIAVARAASYGDTPGAADSNKSKMWIFATLAAVLAVAGGYFIIDRSAAPSPAVPAISKTSPIAPPGTSTSPGMIVTPAAPLVTAAPAPAPAPSPAPSVTKPPAAPVKPVPTPPIAVPAPVAPPVVTKTFPDNKEAARIAEEEKLGKTKREAQDKAKAEALEKAAKNKAENDERVRKLKQEAEERAAAVRVDQEEKARRAREEEDRLAAAKARQEAERQKSASTPTSGGVVVTPPRRTVEELSSAGNAAFKRNEVAAARAAWNELVAHPEATARSKAIAYNNLAVSYCQNSDETNCERMYLLMLRADRGYGVEVSERELPLFKRAHERALRQLR